MLISGETARYELTHLNQNCFATTHTNIAFGAERVKREAAHTFVMHESRIKEQITELIETLSSLTYKGN